MEFLKYRGYSDNCSTVIVGKNVSTTGKVILGHNEDTYDSVVQLHLVPRVKHSKGEVLTFADGRAVVPQVEETYAYYWSEFRSTDPTLQSWADSFVNEWGVAVVSNSCHDCNCPDGFDAKQGVGYGLRRIIAERAKTAREGVEVAAYIMDNFGYTHVRSYRICDKDEAWLFMCTTGKNYAARRVGDDEIIYIPNWYTIGNVDFNDTEHKKFYWSKTLASYAEENGWYKPKIKGDYSDFNFRNAYMGKKAVNDSNRNRSDLAWSYITGGDPLPYGTFGFKPDKKFSMADLRGLFRQHYKGWEKDLESDSTMSPHRLGICRDTTNESMIVEFNEDVNLTCMWRASPRPCRAPYTPFYLGMKKLPKSYELLPFKASQETHFDIDLREFSYHEDFAYNALRILQNLMEFDYRFCQDLVHGDIEKMENYWLCTKPLIDKAYKELISRGKKDEALQLLTDYTCAQGEKVVDWAKETVRRLTDMRDKARSNYWRSL
jgi:dipeptidase